jgi:hypothetical protein
MTSNIIDIKTFKKNQLKKEQEKNNIELLNFEELIRQREEIKTTALVQVIKDTRKLKRELQTLRAIILFVLAITLLL